MGGPREIEAFPIFRLIGRFFFKFILHQFGSSAGVAFSVLLLPA